MFTSGDGSLVGALPFRVFLSNLSPRMWLRCWAMTLCCSTPQWFSTDRMTGYSDTCMGRRRGEGASRRVSEFVMEHGGWGGIIITGES